MKSQNQGAMTNSVNGFGAMDLINAVTGIKGLPARQFALWTNHSAPVKFPWYHSKTYAQFIWQGDTSSDEIVGHIFVYPLVSDLVGTKNATVGGKARQLLLDIMSYIQRNDWYLIDANGKRTKWGVWNPAQINDDEFFYDERGVNSNQILSWLITAYRVRPYGRIGRRS
jgi:hypothetical protein